MTVESPRVVGRYALCDAIAAGGMATVHIGRLLGPVGFSRTVAIKRLHEQFSQSDEFVTMFLDEARLVARIRHPNVVPTLDIVATTHPKAELFLVMEYVTGESLAKVLRGANDQGWRVPPRVVASILAATLHGLHAAHEAADEHGQPLGIVHRDVSPQNILVGTDGVPRILDFGVAKAAGRVQTTQAGQVKGKLAYMAPEQVRSDTVSRQTDVYAAAICLWEGLCGQRLFTGSSDGAILAKVLDAQVGPPSSAAQKHKIPLDDEAMTDVRRLDSVVMRGLARDPHYRFQTAREMALMIEQAVRPATGAEIATWVEAAARKDLAERAQLIARIERDDTIGRLAPSEQSYGQSNGNVQMIASRASRPDVASGVLHNSAVVGQVPASQSRPSLAAMQHAQLKPLASSSSPSPPYVMGAPQVASASTSQVSQVSQVGYVGGHLSGISQINAGGHISGLSQLSGIAMTAPADAGAPKRSHLPVIAFGAAATICGIGIAVALAAFIHEHRGATTEASGDGNPSSAAASPAPPSSSTASAVVSPSPMPTVVATAPIPAPASNVGGSVVLDSPDNSAHPAASASASASDAPVAPAEHHHHHHDPCSPPYTTDASGIRHYKPQCI